jgi:hypothetical protein
MTKVKQGETARSDRVTVLVEIKLVQGAFHFGHVDSVFWSVGMALTIA